MVEKTVASHEAVKLFRILRKFIIEYINFALFFLSALTVSNTLLPSQIKELVLAPMLGLEEALNFAHRISKCSFRSFRRGSH